MKFQIDLDMFVLNSPFRIDSGRISNWTRLHRLAYSNYYISYEKSHSRLSARPDTNNIAII